MANAASPADKTSYIREKLAETARAHNIKIILAIESGSRAWGFPSTDSDYDVRFIYSRSEKEYLSVREWRDVVETELVHDNSLGVPIDLNGWDLKKALRLALNSNAVVAEWLVSPVIYMSEKAAAGALLKFASDAADIESFMYHYDRLARHAWTEITESAGPVKIKRYFYALRPALALASIRKFQKVPPMNIGQMMDSLVLPDSFVQEVYKLIGEKADAVETSLIERRPVLDTFLEENLSEKVEKPREKPFAEPLLKKADQMFRDILSESKGLG